MCIRDSCHGELNGSARFQVINGSPPFSYNWRHLQSGLSGTGTDLGLADAITLDGLPAGEVIVEVNDGYGNTDILIIDVDEPDPLVLDSETILYNEFNVSCSGASDGGIDLITDGGTPPYMYAWSTGGSDPSIQSLSAGPYRVTATDLFGCEASLEVTLSEPLPISIDATFNDPTCDGLDTGSLQIDDVTGGTTPYLASLNNSTFTMQRSYENLEPGSYTLEVMDANLCLIEIERILTAPQIPICLLYTSPSPRDRQKSRMPSSA